MAEDTIEWPYCFCLRCRVLSPIRYKGDNRTCMKCEYLYERGEGREVMLSRSEAKVRKLLLVDMENEELDED